MGSRHHDIGALHGEQLAPTVMISVEFTAQAIASRRQDIGALRVTSNKSLVVCITAEFLFI